jgi:hypothetical protein
MSEKQTKGGLSLTALRLIYLGIGIIFVAAAILLFSIRSSQAVSLFGFEANMTNTKVYSDFVETLKAGFDFNKKGIDLKAVISAVFGILFISGITVYELVISIIALVYFIILLITTIVYGVKKKDAKDTEGKFHALERRFAKILTLFLIFDCFIVVCGGTPTKSFMIEIVLVVALFAGNSISNVLRRELASGHKFDVQNFIYSILEMAIVGLTIFAIFMGLTKEHFFYDFYHELVNMVISITQGAKPQQSTFIFFGATIVKTVGFFLALSMIKRVLSYYPYNDKLGAEGIPATNSLLGKSIACIILYLIAGMMLKSAGYYADIMEVLKSGVLVLLGVLGVAITLKVAQKLDAPKAKEEKAEAPAKAEEPKEEAAQ